MYGHRQNFGPGPGCREYPASNVPESVAVTGKLELIDGKIALTQDTTTYYIIGLRRLIGFIDGLKEGAEVTLEGAARPLPGDGERKVLLVSKLGINGKTYDNLSPALTDRAEKARQPNPPGMGRGRDHRRNPQGSRNPEKGFRNPEQAPRPPEE
jgi:hypothetical protein